MAVAFNFKVLPFSGHIIQSSRQTFSPASREIGSVSRTMRVIKCSSLNASTDFMQKLPDTMRRKVDDSLLIIHDPADIPSNLRTMDTLQSLGVGRYFQSQINTLLHHTYRLWKEKEKNMMFKDVGCCALAFRLLRENGYQVSSDEVFPFAEQELVRLETSDDVATILELYRASQARLCEDEHTLEKLHDWSSNLLKQHLLNESIPDHKLHKQVEYFLKNYHGILDRVAVRRSLDLYNQYQIPEVADRFPNEDFLEFSRQDFNICQAQHQKELQQLQRWYADCRLDTLNYERDGVRAAIFLTSAIFGEPELSEARLAFAKHTILVGHIDDFFDHAGSREESYKILDLVQEWKEKPSEEYGSKEVEVLFTAVYNTVNNLAEKAHIEQGRCVKPLLIKPWVEILTSCKKELDAWTEETALTLDEYLSFSWVTIGCRICILNSLQFLGIKLSEEMLSSQECMDLSWHASAVVRLLNDVQTFEKERLENTTNSVDLLVAAHNSTEEEAVSKIKEVVDYHRRKLMQIVYKEGTIFPRECKDVFLRVCRMGYYLYASVDEFTSPQQMKEDMKSLVYEPLMLHPLEANNEGTKN